jgi:hypothetical protein
MTDCTTTTGDAAGLKIGELREALKKFNAKGCSGLRKDELIALLRKYEQDARSAEEEEARVGDAALVSAAAAVLRASSKRRASPERGGKVMIAAPLTRGRKRSASDELEALRSGGGVAARAAGTVRPGGSRTKSPVRPTTTTPIGCAAAGRTAQSDPRTAAALQTGVAGVAAADTMYGGDDGGGGMADRKLLNECVKNVKRTQLERVAADMDIERAGAKRKKRALLDDIIDRTITDKLTAILALGRDDRGRTDTCPRDPSGRTGATDPTGAADCDDD